MIASNLEMVTPQTPHGWRSNFLDSALANGTEKRFTLSASGKYSNRGISNG